MLTESEICTVAEDLEYLRDSWGHDPGDAEIRRGSPVLRRLLVDGVYGHVWRLCGFGQQPRIHATDLAISLGEIPPGWVNFAAAGGATHQGAVISVPILILGNRAVDPIVLNQLSHPPDPMRSYSITDYLESICAVINGKRIKRRELIKYMANTRGGVHLGKGKAKAKERIMIEKVRTLESAAQLLSKDSLFYEFLSIGQCLGLSADAGKLIDKIQSKG